MKIAIITAMPEETTALLKRFGCAVKSHCGNLPAYRFDYVTHEIMLCEAGMGLENAAVATEIVVREFAPAMLISCGYCGGIAPDLNVGDVVVASGVAIVSGTEVRAVQVEIPAVCGSFIAGQSAEGVRISGGLFLSTPLVMSKKRLASLLPAGVPDPVVEMESAAVAAAARESGISFVGIRAVSDQLDEELDFSLEELCDARMRISIPRVLLTVARKPHIIPQLARLARNSRVAGSSLARAVEQFLKFV